MTDTPDAISREEADAEQRGQRLLVAALDVCASGRQMASAHLAKKARDQLIALWKIREEAAARATAALREAADAVVMPPLADGSTSLALVGDEARGFAMGASGAHAAILALIPDAGAAFDRAIAEAVQAEREACAKRAEAYSTCGCGESKCMAEDDCQIERDTAERIAAAIRASTEGEG